MNKDPTNDREWQEAVDMAHCFLLLDSARRYGLVRGGPEVNADRCTEILNRAARRGITPSPDAIVRFAKSITN